MPRFTAASVVRLLAFQDRPSAPYDHSDSRNVDGPWVVASSEEADETHSSKALPDFGGPRAVGNMVRNDSRLKWKAKLREHLARQVLGKRPRKSSNLAHPGVKNAYALKAWDHALQSCVPGGLSVFQAKRSLRPLRKDERRFWVKVDSLPASIQKRAHRRTRRACIATTNEDGSRTTRLEADWSEQRRILHSWLDMGSSTFQNKYYAYLDSEMRIRGWFWLDPEHRRHDNTKNAIEHSNLKWARLEVSITTGLRAGPWDGASFFGTIQEAATQYFSSYDFSDGLFELAYPVLAFDQSRGDLPSHFGTDEHKQEVWQVVCVCVGAGGSSETPLRIGLGFKSRSI